MVVGPVGSISPPVLDRMKEPCGMILVVNSFGGVISIYLGSLVCPKNSDLRGSSFRFTGMSFM